MLRRGSKTRHCESESDVLQSCRGHLALVSTSQPETSTHIYMKEISAITQHSLIPILKLTWLWSACSIQDHLKLCSLAFLKYEMFQETYTGVRKSENALKIWNLKSSLNLEII